jgi:hypothetical protein
LGIQFQATHTAAATAGEKATTNTVRGRSSNKRSFSDESQQFKDFFINLERNRDIMKPTPTNTASKKNAASLLNDPFSSDEEDEGGDQRTIQWRRRLLENTPSRSRRPQFLRSTSFTTLPPPTPRTTYYISSDSSQQLPPQSSINSYIQGLFQEFETLGGSSTTTNISSAVNLIEDHAIPHYRPRSSMILLHSGISSDYPQAMDDYMVYLCKFAYMSIWNILMK